MHSISWTVDGRRADLRAIKAALDAERRETKALHMAERQRLAEANQSDLDAKKVGAAIRKAVREQERATRRSVGATFAAKTLAHDSGRTCKRFEAMLDHAVPKPSARGSDGLSSFHFKLTSRGFSGSAAKGARRYRIGEAVRHLKYIVREQAREIAGGGIVSNVSSDPAELAGFFDALEALESQDRANANVYISLVISLPHELVSLERERVLGEICEVLAKLGLPFAAVLHAPGPEGDPRNYHAHVMLSLRPTRVIAPGQYEFSAAKSSDLNDGSFIVEYRRTIATLLNAAMMRGGHERRFTALSNAERGLAPRTKASGKSTPGQKNVERRARKLEDDRAKLQQNRDQIAAMTRLLDQLVRFLAAPVRDFAGEIAIRQADLAERQALAARQAAGLVVAELAAAKAKTVIADATRAVEAAVPAKANAAAEQARTTIAPVAASRPDGAASPDIKVARTQLAATPMPVPNISPVSSATPQVVSPASPPSVSGHIATFEVRLPVPVPHVKNLLAGNASGSEADIHARDPQLDPAHPVHGMTVADGPEAAQSAHCNPTARAEPPPQETTHVSTNTHAILARAGGIFLALHERSDSDPSGRASARTLSSLRKLSGIAVVHDATSAALLLRGDADDHLGRHPAPGDELRRSGAGGGEAERREVAQPTAIAPGFIEIAPAAIDMVPVVASTVSLPTNSVASDPASRATLNPSPLPPIVAEYAVVAAGSSPGAGATDQGLAGTPVVKPIATETVKQNAPFATHATPPVHSTRSGSVEREPGAGAHHQVSDALMRHDKGAEADGISKPRVVGIPMDSRRRHPAQPAGAPEMATPNMGRSPIGGIANGLGRLARSLSRSQTPVDKSSTGSKPTDNRPPLAIVPLAAPPPRPGAIALRVSKGLQLDNSALAEIIKLVDSDRLSLEVTGSGVDWRATDLEAVGALSSISQTPAGQRYIVALASALPAAHFFGTLKTFSGDLQGASIQFRGATEATILAIFIAGWSRFDRDDRQRAILIATDLIQFRYRLRLKCPNGREVICGSVDHELVKAVEMIGSTGPGYAMVRALAEHFQSESIGSPGYMATSIYPPQPVTVAAEPAVVARVRSPATVAPAKTPTPAVTTVSVPRAAGLAAEHVDGGKPVPTTSGSPEELAYQARLRALERQDKRGR